MTDGDTLCDHKFEVTAHVPGTDGCWHERQECSICHAERSVKTSIPLDTTQATFFVTREAFYKFCVAADIEGYMTHIELCAGLTAMGIKNEYVEADALDALDAKEREMRHQFKRSRGKGRSRLNEMTQEQVRMVMHGLYRVYWKDGGQSLASVGSLPDGTRWLAPANWVSVPMDRDGAVRAWRSVAYLEIIDGE